jgi:hypothetical protein
MDFQGGPADTHMHGNVVPLLGVYLARSAAILTELGMSLSMVGEPLTEVRVYIPWPWDARPRSDICRPWLESA